MIRHLRFILWALKLRLFYKIRPGTVVATKEPIQFPKSRKAKPILGVVMYLDASRSEWTGEFTFHIKWLRPLEGDDPKYHSKGWYNVKQFKEIAIVPKKGLFEIHSETPVKILDVY